MPIYSYTPINGKQELEGLVIGHYSDPMIFYREYIQNACDSIVDAANNGILSSIDEGHVAITISYAYKYIKVRDNGTGIPKDKVLPTLMDMYHSDKDGIETAGRFGIGRLSGGGFCRKLIFRTTTAGENEESVFTIDVDLLRNILDDKSKDLQASEVMQEICSIEYNSVDVDEHYMEIQLQNVIHAEEDILDEDKVVNFIQDIAPIDYNTAFKQLIYTGESEYVNKCKSLKYIHVSVNDQTDIKKRYGLKIVGTDDDIEKLQFFTFSDKFYGELAWGWYAVTPFSIQIPTTDHNAGIRLRCHNISLSQDILNQYFSEERGNQYFYGEIFTTHSNISPNTGRQGLRPSDEATIFIAKLKEYFKTLSSVYKKANTIKSRLRDVKERLESYQKQSAGISQAERDVLLKRLEGDVNKFLDLAHNEKAIEEVKSVYSIYEERYNNTYRQTIDRILHPNTFSTAVQENRESVSINFPIKTTSTTQAAQETQAINPKVVATPSVNQIIEDSPKPEIPITPAKPQTGKQQPKDIFAKLAEGGFNSDDISLIRRVLGMMTVICPPQNKAMLEKLKMDTIDLLIKTQPK